MGAEALIYVGRVLDIVAAEWFRADALDGPAFRRRHLAAAAAADTPERCHDVVDALLGALDDGHSHLIRPERAAAAVERRPALPEGRMRGKVACLDVPWFVHTRHLSREGFAGRLQALLAGLDAERPAGWVVDLRGNGGGDMWPMLAGLGPLLGGGPFGAFVAARTLAWTYREGTAFDGDRPMCGCEGAPVALRSGAARVAVLLGAGTASAGEAVAIAFRGRTDTRSFGRPTAGQSTANASHILSDGAVLALVGALMADRDGVAYGGELEPDVPVPSDEGGPARDPTLDRAAAWAARGDA